jgi:uncharacterized membrane protein YphA (DoxX/SURF4 family)
MPFLADYTGWGATALGVVLGLIFVVHGWAKLRNPVPVGKLFGKGRNAGLLFGIVEVLAGVMIATGKGTFTSSVVIIVIMLGAVWFKVTKWKTPFTTDATGWEFDLLIIAAALALLLG